MVVTILFHCIADVAEKIHHMRAKQVVLFDCVDKETFLPQCKLQAELRLKKSRTFVVYVVWGYKDTSLC